MGIYGKFINSQLIVVQGSIKLFTGNKIAPVIVYIFVQVLQLSAKSFSYNLGFHLLFCGSIL